MDNTDFEAIEAFDGVPDSCGFLGKAKELRDYFSQLADEFDDPQWEEGVRRIPGFRCWKPKPMSADFTNSPPS